MQIEIKKGYCAIFDFHLYFDFDFDFDFFK